MEVRAGACAVEPAPIAGMAVPPGRSRIGAAAGSGRHPCRLATPQRHGAREMHMRKVNRKSNGVTSGTPWNDQVAQLMSREGMSRDKARDKVIMEQLKRGDGSALAALLIDGYVPAPNVRFVLALMLLENEAAEDAIARQHVDPNSWWLPHRLVFKSRPGKPRRPQSAHEPAGGRTGETRTGAVMPQLAYEAAIARLDQAVRATDPAGSRTAAAGRPKVAQRGPAPKRKR
jgi:hypothetical protein